MKQLIKKQDKNKHLIGFTLIELLVAIAILAVITSLSIGSFLGSQIKARDGKRKSDLKQVAAALEAYYNDFGEYPVGDNGKIEVITEEQDITFDWGESFYNPDQSSTIYMVKLPSDFKNRYFYESSDGSYYRLFARLENLKDLDLAMLDDEPGYYQNTYCTNTVSSCNYGITSSNSSLDATSGVTIVEEGG